MKPSAFDYVRAESLDAALDVLAETGSDARIIAGGQSLMPMLNMRLARPSVLVDIMGLPQLRVLQDKGGEVTVGAGMRQAQLLGWPQTALTLPLVAAAMPWIGHTQTRSRGTVCGSIAHADPSAELPLVLVTLGGKVQLRSRRRRRTVEAEQFFVGMMDTVVGDDELVKAITLPVRLPGAGYAFREFGRRQGDFAIVACAAIATASGVRLGIGGVADFPVVRDLPPAGDPGLDDAINDFAWAINARSDLHATARYRRDLIRNLGRATIEEAEKCRT